MNLLQNSAGNFLNMTPQEARALAAKLLKGADEAMVTEAGRGAGFVQTIVIREWRLNEADALHKKSYEEYGYGELDTIFVGISPTWTDIHPSLEAGMKPRESRIMHINRNDVNVRLKGGA